MRTAKVRASYSIKRYLKTVLWLLIILPSIPAFSQQVIRGAVYDAKTHEPLAGVSIQVPQQPAASGISDVKGVFHLTPVGSDSVKLVFSSIGYETLTQLVSASPAEVLLNIALQPSEHALNQVIVSAGRHAQDVKRLTVSTEVIQPYLFNNKGTTTMEKFMEQVPGVNVVDGQINIRGGSGWTYGAGSRVLVLVDDMPILTGDGAQVPWKFIPTENLAQVEVIKGASSVLYGSSALNGVIHFRTAKPSAEPVTVFSPFYAMYQDFSQSTYHTAAPKTQSGFQLYHAQQVGRLDLSLSTNLLHDDGYRYGENEDRARISMHTNYHHRKIAGLTYGIDASVMKQLSASFLLWESYNDRYLSLDYGKTVTDAVNLSIDPHADFYALGLKHRIRTRYLKIDNTNSGGTANQSNASDLFYADYQLQRTWRMLVLTGGVNAGYTESNSPLYGGVNRTGNLAPFLQTDLEWKRLTLTGGLRYENFRMNSTTDHRLIKRAGLNVQVLRYTFLRASYGEGYRYPSIAERYITTSVGAVNIFPNPDLRPETGWNAEVGIKQGLKIGKVQGFIDAAYFRTEYDDMVEFNFGQWRTIDFDNVISSFGFKSYNVGKTRIDGWDLSLTGEGQAGKLGIRVLAGYTKMNPVSLEPDRVFAYDSATTPNARSYSNTSSDTANKILKYRYTDLARADVQLSYGIVSFGVSMRYNSYMQNIDNVFVTLPFTLLVPGVDEARSHNKHGDFIWDCRLGAQFSKHVKANVVVNNVFNHEMMTRPTDMRPPRLVMLQLTFTM